MIKFIIFEFLCLKDKEVRCPNVIDLLDEAIRILNMSDIVREQYSSEIKSLVRRRENASTNTYKIGVIGVTSSGKSTMINSLLGSSILPSRVRPSSSQLVRCYYGEKDEAIIYFDDNSTFVLKGEDFNSNNIAIFADETLNVDNKERVKELEIRTHGFSLDKDVVLVDSPGLDAFGYEGHEKLTITGLLPTVDFCILVTTCKTNSDQKLLSILNTISDNSSSGTPVIIVQNMLDSIMPSPDGSKSRNEVARDHITRLKRVVNSSSIKDKSNVKIIQYSSLLALRGLVEKSKRSKTLLNDSNYYKLVDLITTTVSSLRPKVNENRLKFAKSEIQRIAVDALNNSGKSSESPTEESFEYDNFLIDVQENIDNIKARCKEELAILKEINYEYSNKINYTESVINSLKSQVSSIEKVLIDTIRETEEYLSTKCDELKVDKRDFFNPISINKVHTPHLCKRSSVFKEEEKGVLGWLKRHNPFGKADSGYINKNITYIDEEETRSKILSYLERCEETFKDAISKLMKRIRGVFKQLEEEIVLRRGIFEEHKVRLLDSQQFFTVGSKLIELSDSIQSTYLALNKSNDVKVAIEKPKEILEEYDCPATSYFMVRYADILKKQIHHSTFNSIMQGICSKCVIIGWDKLAESECLDKFFNLKVSVESIYNGHNQLKNEISVLHMPDKQNSSILNGNLSIFILVNAIQIGAAEKQIYDLLSQYKIGKSHRLFFVIQDFAEVISANEVYGVFMELQAFIKSQFPNANTTILLLHANPIYNMALASSQLDVMNLQTDRINIVNELNRKFHFLFENETIDILHDIIKSLE